MCIDFVRCGPPCGAEFNAVAESQLDAERERSNREVVKNS